MIDPFDDPTLADPDGETDTKYSWDKEFQRHIAALLIADRQFLLQSLDLVKPGYFTDKAHSKVVKLAFEFFKKYRILARKDFIVQELKTELAKNKALPYYLAEVNVLFDYFQPGLEARDYLQNKITYFAKIQAVKTAFNESLSLMAEAPESDDTWNSIYDKMRTAMATQQTFDIGVDYFQSIKDRYANMADDAADGKDRFPTGLEGIDKEIKGGGYNRGEIFSVVAGSGVGKCYGENTYVLMFDGTTKAVQDIVVGDVVMGDDSTPRNVLGTHSGMDDMYDVIPKKGSPYRVNSEHTLVLKRTSDQIDRSSRCVSAKFDHSQWKNGEYWEISVKDYLKETPTFRDCMKGVRAEVEFPEKSVPIDPYYLGIWLGDGTSHQAEVTTADNEVVGAMMKVADKIGMEFKKKKSLGGKASVFSINSGKHTGIKHRNLMLNELRDANLLKNKHVPHTYKANSREVRLQVLAGLMDSDGSKSNNCFDFTNKNKTLVDDVVFLARSLGLSATVKPCRKSCQGGFVGDYWRVTISGDTSIVPVKIARKRCLPREQIKDCLKVGIRVEPAGFGRYYGFETDGNHRFLLGDFTVVHNSVLLACMTSTNLLQGKRGVYISLELAEEKVAERIDAIMTGFPIQCLYNHKDEIFERLSNFEHVKLEGKIWPLVIKQFAAGTATVNTIRAYISQLRFQGFDPDFVIVDYVGEMQDYPDMKTYESREKIVRDLRGMATEEEIFVATAMQPNRDGKSDQKDKGERSRIDDSNLADSFGQIRPLDGCISLNQNDNEKQLGIGRAYIIKQRDGKSRYQIYLSFNKENLKIKEITKQEYLEALNAQKDYVSDEVKVDMITNKGWSPSDGADIDAKGFEDLD